VEAAIDSKNAARRTLILRNSFSSADLAILLSQRLSWSAQRALSSLALVLERVFAGGDSESGVFFGKEGFEAGLVDGLHVSFLRGDHSLLEFFPDGFVHELHSFSLTADDDIEELLSGPFADDGLNAYREAGRQLL